MNPTALVMTASQHKNLHDRLFPGDGLETSAILFCNQSTGEALRRLVVDEVICLPYDECERTDHSVTWPFAKYLSSDKITQLDRSGQSIVTIHSHPSDFSRFSEIDDTNDRAVFQAVDNWFDDGRPNGSAIMLPDGSIRARIFIAPSDFQEMFSVSVVGEDIHIWRSAVQLDRVGYEFKLKQTFGSHTLSILRSLRVGVVGCSGTGSIVVELLARNGIGKLVLVDDDFIEERNLNRIVNSTLEAAQQREPKVEALRKVVLGMGLGTTVKGIQQTTDSLAVTKALIDCDLVFGCTDTAYGRYHLDCLTSAHLIPYFDVGVNLDADGKGGVSAADAVCHYVHPDGDDLLARDAYSMDQVTAELWHRNDFKTYNQRRIAGYLTEVGEDQPAVMSVNMQAACMAFNDFLARIHSIRYDQNNQFSTQIFRLAHGHYDHYSSRDDHHPLIKRFVGSGDRSLLVKNNIVND